VIWLIGDKGMLGTELSRLMEKAGLPFAGTDREVDIADPAALGEFAEKRARFNWIINCAAYTAVDKAEDDIETCRRLNTRGAANIAACAQKIGARLIHLSTDYVFDGNREIAPRQGVKMSKSSTLRRPENATAYNNSRLALASRMRRGSPGLPEKKGLAMRNCGTS